MKTNLTSIQISVKHRNLLKKYCDNTGYTMSGAAEKLIEERTSPIPRVKGYDGVLRPVPGLTPFGMYDLEKDFCDDCIRTSHWVATRLGHPAVQIELFDSQFYAAFEESVDLYNSLCKRTYEYTFINNNGRHWIRRYFFAICQEILGTIRMKYPWIPVPGGQVQLDGAELKIDARHEKEVLIRELSTIDKA